MRIIRIPIIFLGILLFPAICAAQETTGNLEGRVFDEAGDPLSTVTVTVSGPSLKGIQSTTTSADGRFSILVLPVGMYSVTISREGFQELTYDAVRIRLGKTVSLGTIHLSEQPYTLPEMVVFGQVPVDPTTTDIGSNLVREQFNDLPVDRNYRNLTTLLPQANGSFLGDEVNFAGGTGLENRYFIDGIDVTDPYRGITGTNLPYNFIKEIAVKTGGYEAQYRSSLGGIVNVITHSGSNDFHGQAFGFFANNRFAGDPRQGALEPATGDFAQYDLGASIGGPIKRDKLWYYLAYNPTFEYEQVEIPGTGLHDDEYTAHIFGGKLTWWISDDADLNFTVFGDPSTRSAVGITFGNWGVTPTSFENPDPYLTDIESGGYNLALSGNYYPSDGFLLQYSLSRVSRRLKYQPTTERGASEVMFIDTETGVFSGGSPQRIDDLSTQHTARVLGSFIWPVNTLTAGIEYRDNRMDFDHYQSGIFRYTDTSYLHATLAGEGTVRNRIPSVFVQDSWQTFDRLRLNAGLRWDGQYLIATNGETGQKILDQYQPRVGLIFLPGKIGTQKIFGTFGRFYQEFTMNLSIIHMDENGIVDFTSYDHDPRQDPSGGIPQTRTTGIQPEVENLEGQHYDEFSLGYEIQVRDKLKFGITGMYRTLGNGVENGNVDGSSVYGNPGSGQLSDFPEMKREYYALVLTAERASASGLNYLASYVLSKNEGNYTGLYASDFGWMFPNANGTWDYPENLENGYGLLPNDSTHRFKLAASYRFGHRFSVGTSFIWQSGTPLTIFEGSSMGSPWYNFAQERGSAGRMPSIWDLNWRFTYSLFPPSHTSLQARLLLDVFHLGSELNGVDFDQIKNFGPGPVDNPNPTYGLATRYQPPTTLRFGLEIDF